MRDGTRASQLSKVDVSIDRVVVRARGIDAAAARALGHDVARSLPDKLVAAAQDAPRGMSRLEVPDVHVRASSSTIADAVARALARRLTGEGGKA
jgi:hypothetical protein